MRLSSPAYDDQLDDLSQDDIDAFDRLDAVLSQGTRLPTTGSPKDKKDIPVTEALRKASALAGEEKENTWTGSHTVYTTAAQDDPDNPFNLIAAPTFKSASSLVYKSNAETSAPFSVFAPASNVPLDSGFTSDLPLARSPSPELPPEVDYSKWFDTNITAPAASAFQPASGFQPTTFVSASTAALNLIPTVFVKASRKGILAPSATAMAEAAEKMKAWQDEDSQVEPPTDRQKSIGSPILPPASPRPALRAVGSAFTPNRMPESPISLNTSTSTTPALGSGFATFATPLSNLGSKAKAKPFKSPLLSSAASRTTAPTFTSSPLKPQTQRHSISTPGPSLPPNSSTTTPIRKQPPINPALMTPMRPLGLTPRGATSRGTPGKPTFVTPFKAGMRPGEDGRKVLEVTTSQKQDSPAKYANLAESWLTRPRREVESPASASLTGTKERWKAFDLTKPVDRTTLVSSGLIPQAYSHDELQEMGINITELSQITPLTAPYYSFHTTSPTPLDITPSQLPPTATLLGPSAAFEQLQTMGCSLATKPWVENHWALILWKVAGMVMLQPEREKDATTRRWCWPEVMRQLRYRYERELNSSSRPPLRLITTQDAPASSPMVLCVSNVTWSEGGYTETGERIEPHPELEVTDGWYRLRARVDGPLARAIQRDVVRVGRKIAVAGARLSSERKEPSEVLQAYNSVTLVLSGNSSHLAPWHAKLGFQAGPYVSTLNSLTPDGGVVASMNVAVQKVYPLAFIEFIKEKDKVHQHGPRNEKEEAQCVEKWQRRWQVEESKIRSQHEVKFYRLEGYAERLESRAGPQFRPSEDELPPDYIDNMYDSLEEPPEAAQVLAGLSSRDAGWLARLIRENVTKERESLADDIAKELKDICPPRDVRSFRVVVVSDLVTRRQPSTRKALLTVWDVLNLSLSEGSSAGAFEPGQKFLVTNLLPTQQRAWMDQDAKDAEVYLCTRRDSRWTRLK